MKSLYQSSRESEQAKKEEELEAFLWDNFWSNFKTECPRLMTRSFIESQLSRLLENHGATDIPRGLFSYMPDDEIIRHTTELYAYVQLTAEGIQEEFFPKALEQSNPYVLRYEVFKLHNQMYDLMTKNKNPNNKAWEAQRSKTYLDAKNLIAQIKVLEKQYPAFAHFLLGYTHYTLGIGGDETNTKAHWKEAYKQFLLCELTEKTHPKASYIVTLGQGIYKDMPFENLEPVKAQIEQALSPGEIDEIVRETRNSLKTKP